MRLCLVQQHPVDEEKIPAAILRWVTLHDRWRDRGHELLSIGPNDRMRFGERQFRGVRQLLVPTPGSGIKSLDMIVFALLLFPVLLKARRELHPDAWFTDELFVAPGIALLRMFHPGERICYDVMGIHFYQVRKNNRKWTRHLLLAPMYALLEHGCLWASSFVTTVNEAHRQILLRWTRRPVHVIRDAAEFPVCEEDPGLPAKTEGQVDLLFVGKISNRRLDDLYSVLPGLMEELPGLRLLIVGDGPFGEYYRNLGMSLGLADRIQFAGFVPHRRLPAWIRHAEITYSDDWSDIGFPMKVFEYMALGAAILVEDTPAIREVMRDGENCLLYHGTGRLAEGIRRLAAQPELRARLGACARSEAVKEHVWESRVVAFEALFAGDEANDQAQEAGTA